MQLFTITGLLFRTKISAYQKGTLNIDRFKGTVSVCVCTHMKTMIASTELMSLRYIRTKEAAPVPYELMNILNINQHFFLEFNCIFSFKSEP